eukprot:COSAG03_NODE_5463_length_1245_cov_1.070681_2_plen_70_part_01
MALCMCARTRACAHVCVHMFASPACLAALLPRCLPACLPCVCAGGHACVLTLRSLVCAWPGLRVMDHRLR